MVGYVYVLCVTDDLVGVGGRYGRVCVCIVCYR